MTHTERSTLAACIAHVAGAAASDVPLDPEKQRAWLAERGLGLVPVADAATFSWPGPWIARRPARHGSDPRAVVMFGVPSGAIWDPADTADEILSPAEVSPLRRLSPVGACCGHPSAQTLRAQTRPTTLGPLA